MTMNKENEKMQQITERLQQKTPQRTLSKTDITNVSELQQACDVIRTVRSDHHREDNKINTQLLQEH